MKKDVIAPSKKPNVTHQVTGKTLIEVSCLNKECYLRLVRLIRSECERAIKEDNQVSMKSIIEELNKEYDIESLRHQLMHIIVSYRQYMDEDILQVSSLIALKHLETYLNMYGVEEEIKQGILNAEQDILEEEAIKQVASFKQYKEMDMFNGNQNHTRLEQLDENVVNKYFKELCHILIIIDRYHIEDVIQVVLDKYQPPVLTKDELLPLLEAYQFMTQRLLDINTVKERREMLKPILKQRLEAFGVTTEIINRVWENEYGASH